MELREEEDLLYSEEAKPLAKIKNPNLLLSEYLRRTLPTLDLNSGK